MNESLPGRVSYGRIPETWDVARWRSDGAFVAVFLNYNKAKTIRRAVEATLAQDFPALEILFMDDASTDGSAETMEEIVRAYRGPHKVTVVRNASNAGICGQWNQVTRLSEGEWFGMFCGDDIPHVDRVASAAKVVSRYSGLLGLSTSMNTFDARTGKPCDYAGYPPEVVEMRGDEPPAELFARRWASGCTAFWRREIFSRSLPSVALDDLFLHWRLLMTAAGRSEVVWAYDGRDKTIDYSVGAGLWSEIRAVRDPSVPKREWERRHHEAEAKVYGRCRETWAVIRAEAVSRGPSFEPFVTLADERIGQYGRQVAAAARRLKELDFCWLRRMALKAGRRLRRIMGKGAE